MCVERTKRHEIHTEFAASICIYKRSYEANFKYTDVEQNSNNEKSMSLRPTKKKMLDPFFMICTHFFIESQFIFIGN